MKAQRLTSYKDIRLDDSVTGADLDRPGFRSLNQDALGNRAYSHIFIHKRDRYGRPEDAIDMVSREKKLLLAGITIVFSDGIAEPMERGRQYPEREFAMLLGYYESGAYLTTLAERVLEKQRLLAREGFRTGGNAPYGLVRVLVDAQGRVLEELSPGRRVRQAGCHVQLRPKNGPEFTVRLYILDLKHQGWGFKRIAMHLNQLGIPSPDAGKIRRDHGVAHLVSGTWCHNTVREICTDPINIGLQEYGRRSEGAHRRLGSEGPRLLHDRDRNAQDQPRTVLNDPLTIITVPTGMAPLWDEQRFQEMRRQIESRGKQQRGIPRTKDPARYPLSCRVLDLTNGCGALLYGRMHGQRPIYVCGRYMRTDGAECANNSVDGEALLRFTLKTLYQLVQRHGNREKLRQLLLYRARHAAQNPLASAAVQEVQILEAKANDLREQLAVVRRRMALEKNDARYTAIAAEFDSIHAEVQRVERELETQRRCMPSPASRTPEAEVNAAMSLLNDFERITTDKRARTDINPFLLKLGIWVGLQFGSAIKGKCRIVRRLLRGVISFGQGQLPIPLYGSGNRQDSGGVHDCFPIARPDTKEKCSEIAAQQRKDVDGRGEKEPAGTGAEAPIPADSELEREPRSGVSQPEGISFTKGSRGERRWTFPNDLAATSLFWRSISYTEEFSPDSFYTLAERTAI
jgi:hypothetical protein